MWHETLSGETVSKKRQWNRTLPLALAIGVACLSSVPSSSLAQGAGGKPPVEIDNSVLEQLGPPSNLPEMLLQLQAPSEAHKIVLIPPKSVAAKAAGKKRKLAVKPPEEAAAPGIVHLHPIKPRAHAAKPAKAPKAAPAAAAPAPAAPAPAAVPAVPAAPAPVPVTSEPLKAPPPAAPAAPAPAPAAPTPAAPPAPTAPAPTAATPPAPSPGTAPQALVALTAQPAGSEAPPVSPAQESLSTIAFDKESARLPDGARDLLAHLASRMSEDATLEVQLLAYAAGNEENASKARRLSLSRALAVRSFLIDQGVRSTRIEVRALGNKVPEGNPDRVDIAVQKRG
jgi:outer membrane protein OmpA-like peptidoglycan-associated protein